MVYAFEPLSVSVPNFDPSIVRDATAQLIVTLLYVPAPELPKNPIVVPVRLIVEVLADKVNPAPETFHDVFPAPPLTVMVELPNDKTREDPDVEEKIPHCIV